MKRNVLYVVLYLSLLFLSLFLFLRIKLQRNKVRQVSEPFILLSIADQMDSLPNKTTDTMRFTVSSIPVQPYKYLGDQRG